MSKDRVDEINLTAYQWIFKYACHNALCRAELFA